MSSQSQRRQSRGESLRPPPLSSPANVTKSSSGPPMASIESPEQTKPSSRPPVARVAQSLSTGQFRVPESPRSAVGDSRSTQGAKVAIPRLKRSIDAIAEDSSRHGGRHRVNHACEPCRHRKTKCSGERPECRHCTDFKISCYYADGKRDRVKKQFGSMTEKVADYETLLRSLLAKVGDEDARYIRTMLDKDVNLNLDESEGEPETATSIAQDQISEDGGAESEVSAGVGSTGALDKTDEDFTREDARHVGFMGKNSELTWMQRLRQENMYGSPDNRGEESDFRRKTGGASPLGVSRNPQDRSIPLAEQDQSFSIHVQSYHLDDLAIETFEAVEPFEMPTLETANHLFHAYLTRVHPTFPIIGRVNLSIQFRKFFSGQIRQPPAAWLAIVNMIFAIAANYSHLIQAEWKGDDRDHLIYFSRARILSMNNDSVFKHPDLQQIQVAALMSLYFLGTSQINRSWTLLGMAIRGATALGLYMRNESTKLPNSLKEIRYRLWWSLYTLEHRLCMMTGRLTSILDDHCTCPLPVPLDEDQFESEEGKILLSQEKQLGDRNPASRTPSAASSTTPSTDRSRSLSKPELSRSPSTQQPELDWAKNVTPNSSLYFLHLVELTRLTQTIFTRLYNPTTSQGSWAGVETIIAELDASLSNWYRALPPIFDFKRKLRERQFSEFRLSLGFYYYSTRIVINRPTMCRMDRKIPNQSTKSYEFNHNAATTCIESAQEMLNLIPDIPNSVGLNSVGPWWSITHFLMQATTMLMLEISFRAHHMPEEAENLLEASKKAVRWLHQMAEESLSAKRAWMFANSMLREAAAKIGREITDMPEIAPQVRSGRSSTGRSDVSMTSHQATGEVYQQSRLQPGLYSNAHTLPNFLAYTNYDPLMQYDQYFPTEPNVSDHMQYTQTTPAEMEFMSNAYHGDQGGEEDEQQGGPSRSRFN